MMQLLFMVVLGQMGLLLSLFFETPFENLAMMALDCLKQGWGPFILRIVEGVLGAVLVSSIFSVVKIYHLSLDSGWVNLMDQVSLANKTILASLTGFLLFFSTMMDRLHQLVREYSSLKEIIIDQEKQLAERKYDNAKCLKSLEREIGALRTTIKQLEIECERTARKAKAAEAKEMALRKQSEEFNLEYDHLLEYNQILQNQLQSIDQSWLENNDKTGWTSLKSNVMCDRFLQFPWGIQTSSESRVTDRENEAQSSNQGDQFLCSGGREMSLPRHRKPIFQH